MMPNPEETLNEASSHHPISILLATLNFKKSLSNGTIGGVKISSPISRYQFRFRES